MKKLLIILSLFCLLQPFHVLSQTKLPVKQTAAKKTSKNLNEKISTNTKLTKKSVPLGKSGKATSKFNPNDAYRPNNNVLANVVYKQVEKEIDGVTINSRMYPSNSSLMKNRNIINGMEETKKKNSATTTEEDGYHCVNESIKITASSEDFDAPYSTSASHIYPGAVYKYTDYYSDNVNPTGLTWPRNSIYLQIDAASGNGRYELVEKPDRLTLTETTGKLKETLTGPPTNASTSISVVSIHNETDFALKTAASAGGWGFKAKAGFGMSKSAYKSSFIIDAKQALYTMNAFLPTDSTTTFFKDAANDKNSDVVFMSSVTYGRRVLGIIETEFENDEMYANFEAKYSGGVANASVGLEVMDKMKKEKTTVKLYLVGGQATVIEIPNATKESVMQKINNYMRTMTWQNAVPINFSFRNMAMVGMRYESATDNFNTKQCVPKMGNAPYNVSVTLRSIENTSNQMETINLGIYQSVYLYVKGQNTPFEGQSEKTVVLPVTNQEVKVMKPNFLYWGEKDSKASQKYGKPDENPRSFRGSINLGKTFDKTLKQELLLDPNSYITLSTRHLCMYGFKDNHDFYENYSKKVYLKDLVAKGRETVTMDVNHSQGRTFRLTFDISVLPN